MSLLLSAQIVSCGAGFFAGYFWWAASVPKAPGATFDGGNALKRFLDRAGKMNAIAAVLSGVAAFAGGIATLIQMFAG